MLVAFDTTLQAPLMIAFFTSIGFGASLSLLRVGGPQVLFFFLIATAFAVVQNVVGILVALPLGADPLLGVLAGSVTLTGGPATGLAFAPLFEAAGVPGAASLAVAAAMVGIVAGGVIGAPLATRLIERHRLHGRGSPTALPTTAAEVVEERMPESPVAPPQGEDAESYLILKNLVAILVAMWAGSWLSTWFTSLGVTLPAYIGAIWEIASLAVPLVAILAAQIALIVVSFWLIFRVMGRDYEAAVMSGGFCGFMLGTTANAMANMRSLVERYGPAPRAPSWWCLWSGPFSSTSPTP
jgi:ESS family glutamate:Na+ symporter